MVGSTQDHRSGSPAVSPSRLALAGTPVGDSLRAPSSGVAAVVPSCRPFTSHPPSWPPFAPRPLRRLPATTGPLTSTALVAARRGSLSFTSPCLLAILSPNTPCVPSSSSRTLHAMGSTPRAGRRSTSPSRRWLVDASGRNGFLSYGLAIHLQLLSTPPHGDAVTFVTGRSDGPTRTRTSLTQFVRRRAKRRTVSGAAACCCPAVKRLALNPGLQACLAT